MLSAISIKDANRDRVMEVLERLLMYEKAPLCTCPDCVGRIAAAALNSMPVHYYVDDKWEEYAGSSWFLVEAIVCAAIAEKGRTSDKCGCSLALR